MISASGGCWQTLLQRAGIQTASALCLGVSSCATLLSLCPPPPPPPPPFMRLLQLVFAILSDITHEDLGLGTGPGMISES